MLFFLPWIKQKISFLIYCTKCFQLLILVSDRAILFSFSVERFRKRLVVRPPLRAETAITGNVAHFVVVLLTAVILILTYMRRDRVFEREFQVLRSQSGITNENSPQMVSETFGIWFYLQAGCIAHCLTSSTAP